MPCFSYTEMLVMALVQRQLPPLLPVCCVPPSACSSGQACHAVIPCWVPSLSSWTSWAVRAAFQQVLCVTQVGDVQWGLSDRGSLSSGFPGLQFILAPLASSPTFLSNYLLCCVWAQLQVQRQSFK